MLQKRNTPVLRFRNLIFKDVLGVLEDWGFDHIKCFTFITQIREGHKISLKIRITGSNGLSKVKVKGLSKAKGIYCTSQTLEIYLYIYMVEL